MQRCPAAPQRSPAGAGGADGPSPGPEDGNNRFNSHSEGTEPQKPPLVLSDLHAPGGVAQAGVRPHLDGSVAQLLGQLQDSRVVRDGLVEVPLGVVGAAQVAVGPRLLPPVLQVLSQHNHFSTTQTHTDLPGSDQVRFAFPTDRKTRKHQDSW